MSSKSPILRCDFFSSQAASVQFGRMTPEHLPPQLSAVLRALNRAVETREPAIRAKVEHLRAAHPLYTHQQLARELIRSTRRMQWLPPVLLRQAWLGQRKRILMPSGATPPITTPGSMH